MFCPYVKRGWTRGTVISYNEEGQETGSIISESYIIEECKKEECGVWHDGRCKYNDERWLKKGFWNG